MIHHLSLAARHPQRVAETIAALWGGTALPFPPFATGSWVAFAGDARRTTIEVYPYGTEILPSVGDADAGARTNPDPSPYGATHAAIASILTREEVFALAAREGCLAKYRKRGGRFGVIEFWLEDSFMLEVLTAEMRAEYIGFMTPETWRAVLAAAPRRGDPARS